MKALKHARTLAASLAVLAASAVASSPAMAFDSVDWNWNTDVSENVDIDVSIDVDVETTGLVQIEKLQIYLGDVSAGSEVFNIANLSLLPLPRDATTQLPIVLSTATAVGNNQSITSDVPVMLHDGQFVANVSGTLGVADLASIALLAAALPSTTDFIGGSNLHTDIAGLFTVGAAVGAFEKANIDAGSTVTNILNTSVDSSATAVANNLSVDLASDIDGSVAPACVLLVCKDRVTNHVAIGDITQFALANVTAGSSVSNVAALGYENLRELTTATLTPVEGDLGNVVQVPTPWVSSVASAIGNNVSITVGRNLTN
jgi:hypothetical protein